MTVKTKPAGLCFKWANQQAIKNDAIVVHGIVTDPLSNPPHSYPHAWIEVNGVVKDWQTMEAGCGGIYRGKGYPIDVFYELFQPQDVVKYEAHEAVTKLLATAHHGSW